MNTAGIICEGWLTIIMQLACMIFPLMLLCFAFVNSFGGTLWLRNHRRGYMTAMVILALMITVMRINLHEHFSFWPIINLAIGWVCCNPFSLYILRSNGLAPRSRRV